MPAWVFASVRPSTIAFTVLCAAVWADNGWSPAAGVAAVFSWHFMVSYCCKNVE